MNTKTATRVPSPDVVQATNLPAVSSETSAIVALIDRAARDPAVDIGKLERLLEMRMQIEERAATVAFDAAMARAQSEMRPVVTDSKNSQARDAKYASYHALDEAIRPIYTGQGFGLSFNTGDGAPAGDIRLLCRVSHRDGCAREYKLDMPADGKGAKGGDVMTRTHATGSAVTYGRRYMLQMIFNMAIERDDDGNAAGAKQHQTPKSRVPSPPQEPAPPSAPHAFKAATTADWAGKMLDYIAAAKTVEEVVAWDELNRANLEVLAQKDPPRLKTVMAAMKDRKAELSPKEAPAEVVTKDGEILPDTMPSPVDDPEATYKWVFGKLAAFKEYAAAEAFWNEIVAPREADFFPPDFGDVMSVWRKTEERLAP